MAYKFSSVFCLLVCLLVLPAGLSASQVKPILELKTPPEGVVIEIITDDEDGMEWVVPKVERMVQQLRQRFPGLDVAIVSHGAEMFAMLENESKNYSEVHQGVQSLMKDNNVELYVCGTYAGWQGHENEDFPSYVNVAAVAPAQINDYLNLGYELIVIGDEND